MQLSDAIFTQYSIAQQSALSHFQMIEEVIKMYIANSYGIIQQRTKGVLPFKYTYKDVKDKPLGALLQILEKLVSNPSLIGELKSLLKDRNHCAHQSFLLTCQEMKNKEFLDREFKRMELVAAKAGTCLGRLLAELKKVELARTGMKDV